MNFISELNKNLDCGLSDDELALMVANAATTVLFGAINGNEVETGLQYKEIGTITTVLLWNVNPSVRKAVKPLKGKMFAL